MAAHSSRLTLAYHGFLYLFAAAFTSGSLQYGTRALAGAFPEAPPGVVWIILTAAILCYIFGAQFSGTSWRSRLFQTLSAALAVVALASILVSIIVLLTATVITPGAAHVAVGRTLTACVLAISLAFAGSRWQRPELIWVAYGTVALATAKLLLEDLRQGRPAFIAASIFLYALTLILVPRAARKPSRRTSSDAAVSQHIGTPTARPT